MRILLSNDDGIMAPGLRILAHTLSSIAQIEVVAPDRNSSGSSNSLTLTKPLRVTHLDNGYYCVEGTPTDCVHLALSGFLEKKVDMVISGINHGANLGDDILYSGTVAGAIEGRNLGFPSLAVSLAGDEMKHYDTAALVVKMLVEALSETKLPSQTILNVNVPDLPFNQIKGIQVTRLGVRHVAEPVVKEFDPRGKPIYWIGPPGIESDAGPGTDFNAINQGYVSVTPLHLDMTHYKVFDVLGNCLDRIKFNT